MTPRNTSVSQTTSMPATEYHNYNRTLSPIIASALGVYLTAVRVPPNFEGLPFYDELQFIVFGVTLKAQLDWAVKIREKIGATTVEIIDDNSAYFILNNRKISILIAPKEIKSLDGFLWYKSYNGVCEIISKVAETLGLIYDEIGLHVNVTDADKIIGKLDIVPAFNESLIILGYNSYNFGYRFRNYEAIYKYICEGKYFNKEKFLEKYPTAPNDRILQDFINYITPDTVVSNYTFTDTKQHPWILNLQRSYPHVVSEYKKLKEAYRIETLMSAKFSPEIVSSLTEFTGSELQEFITKYRQSFKDNEGFNRFILASLPTTIAISIKNYIEPYKLEKTKVKDSKLKKKKTVEDTVLNTATTIECVVPVVNATLDRTAFIEGSLFNMVGTTFIEGETLNIAGTNYVVTNTD